MTIAIIAMCCMIAGLYMHALLKTHFSESYISEAAQIRGKTLVALPKYRWSLHPYTLVLAIPGWLPILRGKYAIL